MNRPMSDQPVDVDMFTSIYNAVNSLNVSDIDFVVDNWAEPWGSQPAAQNAVAATSASGLQLKIVAGIFAVHDGTRRRRTGQRHWRIQFPNSSSFSQPPVVVATAMYTHGLAEPVATSIQHVDTGGFRINAQSHDNRTIDISHFSYIAMGM